VSEEDATMVKGLIWWAGQALIAVFSLGVLVLGIDLCRAAFHLKEPYHFMLTLFASNLIILVSAAFFAGLIVRAIGRLKGRHPARFHTAMRDETEPPKR
jgi:hypothetical protein